MHKIKGFKMNDFRMEQKKVIKCSTRCSATLWPSEKNSAVLNFFLLLFNFSYKRTNEM